MSMLFLWPMLAEISPALLPTSFSSLPLQIPFSPLSLPFQTPLPRAEQGQKKGRENKKQRG